jgi:3-deoxy-D-arabino-heptulosonate 7-phosphate (DAHP) synthase class II|tara:strand:+ start:1395 stop:1529 length:135 start_codon:yes stop_codon:yes gene_type:complete
MNKDEALQVLEEIKENVNVCCAVTMEPEDVLELIEKLESYINEQ